MEDTAQTSGEPGPVVIFGGRSEIGLELATTPGTGRWWCSPPAASTGSPTRLLPRAAGAAAVHTVEFDADDLGSHGPWSGIDRRLWADRHGGARLRHSGDQARAESDAGHAVAIVQTDYVAQISLLTHLAAAMRSAGRGRLVVFSSVAGCGCDAPTMSTDRPRPVWTGSPADWPTPPHGSGVSLLIVRPGFVIGRMTDGMDPAALEHPGSGGRGDSARWPPAAVRWVPWALRPVFFGMKLLPQAVWRRMPADERREEGMGSR